MPHIDEIAKKFGAKGLNVFAVNIGLDDMKAIKDFSKEQKLNSIKFLASPPVDDPGNIRNKYGVVATPTTLILDSNGKVMAQVIGAHTDQIEAALADLGFKD